jgi:hypothetical protein
MLIFFLILYMRRTCWHIHFLFYDTSLIVPRKILKTWQIGYMLTNSCCTEEVTPGLSAQLGPGVLCKPAMWHNWVTSIRVARLALALLNYTDIWRDWVTPIRVVQLVQDLLSQLNPWRDWESHHRVRCNSRNDTSHARQSGMTGVVPIVLNALRA